MATYRAKRVPAELRASGWYEILPGVGEEGVVELEGEVRADWVIVGAGFVGLTAAKRLGERRPGERVVVMDAQRVAWGAAGRNSGFMVDLPHHMQSDAYAGAREADLKEIRMNRVAIEYAARAVEEFGLGAHFSRCGKYHGAVDEEEMPRLEGFCRHLDGLGEAYQRLGRAEMREVTGVDFYAGGMHTPGAALVQPAGYVRGLAKGLRGRGVVIYENSPVVRMEGGDGKGGGCVVHTAKGRVSAGKVILATNGHAESFGFFRKRLMHIFTYASMTRALSGAEQRKLGGMREWGLIPADPLGSTVRRYGERIVVRNSFAYRPNIHTSEAEVRRFGRRHDLGFRRRFGMLRGVEMQYRWGGAVCLSRNSVPAFGEVAPGIYAAVCHNGLGVAKGSYAGIAVADLACGEENEIVADLAAYAPPQKLYPQVFMRCAARAMLWWKQRKVAAGW